MLPHIQFLDKPPRLKVDLFVPDWTCNEAMYVHVRAYGSLLSHDHPRWIALRCRDFRVHASTSRVARPLRSLLQVHRLVTIILMEESSLEFDTARKLSSVLV